MQRLSNLITQVTELEGISTEFMFKRKTMRAVWCKHIISWLSIRVYGYEPHIVSSALGYSVTRNVVTQACRAIDDDIYTLNPHTLYLLTEILCKEGKMTKEKTGGICSPSDLYNMLLKSLPSELQNTLRTRGKNSPTDTTATKQRSSATSSNMSRDTSTTKNPDYPTSLTSHGTPSFSYTSDTKWANREALRYDYATLQEQRQIYDALCAACEWGRKCDYDNHKRKSELKDQNIYSSIID